MFKSSADAGKKTTFINPHEDDVIICAIRMKDGKQMMTETITESEFDACDIKGVLRRISSNKNAESKAITESVMEEIAITAKAAIVGTGNVGRSVKGGISNFFSSIAEKRAANAELYDQHKAEKACQKATTKCADQA